LSKGWLLVASVVASFACAPVPVAAVEPSPEGVTFAQGNTAPGDRLQVFVGRLVKVSDALSLCDGNCMSFDAKYEATFEVIEPISGTYAIGQKVDFVAFAHTGGPGAAAAPFAVLYLWEHDFGNVMVKYSGTPVFPTRDGQWSSCGDPYRDDVPRRKRILAPRKYDAFLYDLSIEKILKSQGKFPEDAPDISLPRDCPVGALARDFAPTEIRAIEKAARDESDD
jgi:hypothetical protein